MLSFNFDTFYSDFCNFAKMSKTEISNEFVCVQHIGVFLLDVLLNFLHMHLTCHGYSGHIMRPLLSVNLSYNLDFSSRNKTSM